MLVFASSAGTYSPVWFPFSCKGALLLSTFRTDWGAHLVFSGPGAFASIDSATQILGLPATEGWALIGGGVAAFALFLSWILIRRGRRRGSTEDLFDSSGRPMR
jgi:hypothetical protein